MNRKLITFLSILSLFLSSPLIPANAAAKAGAKCNKAGSTEVVKDKSYTCVKTGKKLAWNKGVKVVTSTVKPTPTPASTSNKAPVVWRFDGKEWISQGSVPQCPSPLILTGELLDFSKVLSIVQPGQIRGGSYKPHAGLRWSEFGGVVKGISIKAPFDGEVVAAAQYISEGNYQFTINIIHPCGIMLRLGHLLEPSDSIKKILSTIPPAIENDSRESFLSGTFIKKDQLIASEVGMVPPASPDSLGTFMDLGIVDLRKKNAALDSNFKSNADIKYALYSVCWYEGNYFSDSDRARVLNLPFSNGDATSDYCKRR
jgi:hypothetical protein